MSDVNCAKGSGTLPFDVVEFVELPERPVPLIVSLCAPDKMGTASEGFGVGILPDPLFGVPGDDATYC
jgi:hypothetical protein